MILSNQVRDPDSTVCCRLYLDSSLQRGLRNAISPPAHRRMLDAELAGESGSAKAVGLEVFPERHVGHCAARAHLRQAPCAHWGKDDADGAVQP